mmetsp:Transcript_22035/g.46376  ORF Transcript_22035/g.46376 Transcript_22035/m.46376 type:complete len:409 (-) Transcript_22035:67-1293(-)
MMRRTSTFVNIAALSARKDCLGVASFHCSPSIPVKSNASFSENNAIAGSSAIRNKFMTSRRARSYDNHRGGPIISTGHRIGRNINSRSTTLFRPLSTSSSCNEDDEEKHDKFFQMEQRNWEKGFEEYDSGFGPLTRQTIPTLLESAGFPPKSVENTEDPFRLLDVATGPGFVLSAALEVASSSNKPIQLIGMDISQNFLSMAKRRIHAQQQHLKGKPQSTNVRVDFVEGNAESLPFPDNTFDSVVCNFGILHFYKQDTFLRECYRVLRPGGKVSFSAWAPPTRTEGFGIALNAIADVGNLDVAVPEGPNFFRFGELEEATKTLEGIGYDNVGSVELSQMKWINVESGEMLYHILLNGTVRTREILLGQTEEQASAVQALVKQRYKTVTDEGNRPLSMPAVVSSGQKTI